MWKNNFQRENNEKPTKAPREFIPFLFFFPLLVIATKEPGTEMTSLIQGISLIYLWGKLYEMKGNFPRTQPIALESFSAGEKQLHTER